MNLLFPTFNRRLLPHLLGCAIAGALIAGLYGVIHDQITYTISPEYFTKMKFEQFRQADFGWPVRVFVAEVGFLATWWVGLIAGWFLARIAFVAWPSAMAWRKCMTGFSIIITIAASFAMLGYASGTGWLARHTYWEETCDLLRIDDVRAFTRVGIIHCASYIGGLLGLIVAIIFLKRSKIMPHP